MKHQETCRHCQGMGTIETEIPLSQWTPPKGHPEEDFFLGLIADAKRAEKDHARLCELNPRAKESYDRQLADTLKQLESDAKEGLETYC